MITLRRGTNEPEKATLPAKLDAVVVGDAVAIRTNTGEQELVVESIIARKNLLSRSYFGKTKTLAANLDRLFIVTAVGDLFSEDFLDRTIASCEYEQIPYSIVLNKTDQSWASFNRAELYQGIGVDLIYSSAKRSDGFEKLEAHISAITDPNSERTPTYAFCGVSGVGKSSIINHFIPGSRQKIGELSTSGQGKQTTTMAMLYHCGSTTIFPAMNIIDLPGLQKFGVTHIPLTEIGRCFPEIKKVADACRFMDCSHIHEPDCAVLKSLASGDIQKSRYDTYLRIRQETEESNARGN